MGRTIQSEAYRQVRSFCGAERPPYRHAERHIYTLWTMLLIMWALIHVFASRVLVFFCVGAGYDKIKCGGRYIECYFGEYGTS